MKTTRNAQSLEKLLSGQDDPQQREEKRHGGRFKTFAVKSELGEVVDMSARGARIKTKGRPAVKQDDQVNFTIVSERKGIPIHARVTWVKTLDKKHYEVGVEFDKMSPEQAAVVREIAMGWSPSFMFRDPKRLS